MKIHDGAVGSAVYLCRCCDDSEAASRFGRGGPIGLSFLHSRRERSFLSASLSLAKSRRSRNGSNRGGWGILETYLPNSKWGSGTVGTFAGAIFGTVLTLFSIRVLGGHGFTVFLAIPFFMGYFSAWLHCYREPRSFDDCAFVAILSVVLTGVILVGIAIEGIFCILMAAPIAIPLALLGALLAYKIREPRYLQPQAHTCGTAGSGVAKNCGFSTDRRAGGLGVPIGDVISTRGPHGRVRAYCGSPVHFFDGSFS
jgi:hypothetical protein